MKFGSVCSGIEAASMAWNPLGWECQFVSEIDPFASAVLAHRHPTVPNFGDMTKFKDWPDATIDVLVGGTPCQSFSIAGLRGGLDDPRGNLMLTYLAIADRYRPEWLVWENVPGVLSSNKGRDFGTFLGGLAELGYGFAYRVLDAQYFNLAQRRERVFVVGCAGDWQRAAAVLFERASLRGDSAPSRKTREDTSHEIASSIGASGRGFSRAGETRGQDPVVAQTLQRGLRSDAESETFVTHALRAEGFDASEDGTGRGTPLIADTVRSHPRPGSNSAGACVVAPPITGNSYGDNHSREGLLTLAIRGRGGESTLEWRDDGIANAILTPNGGRAGIGVGAVAFNARQDPDVYIERTGPLDTDGSTQAIAFSCKDHGADAGELAPTLRAMGHTDSHANAGGQVAVAFTQNSRSEVRHMPVAGALAAEPGAQQQTYVAHLSPTLKAGGNATGGDRPPGTDVDTVETLVVPAPMAVRRLTPRECERLQGFPDDYTRIPLRNKAGKPNGKWAKDGPRYKVLGNSMARPVMSWIGGRIQMVHDLMVDITQSTEVA